jgi:hypothetical protein
MDGNVISHGKIFKIKLQKELETCFILRFVKCNYESLETGLSVAYLIVLSFSVFTDIQVLSL